MWITPITDRTSSDVSYIKNLTSKIMSVGFDGLTEDEKDFWVYGHVVPLLDYNGNLLLTSDLEELFFTLGIIKGAFNVQDIKRIENNILYLHKILTDFQYNVDFKQNPTWNENSIPHLDEINNVRDNVHSLVLALHSPSDCLPIVYSDFLDWRQVNVLEHNLLSLYNWIELMKDGFVYSGTFYSGQNIVL